VKLYYGGRRAATMAYDTLYKTWEEKHGVEVIPVLSQGGTKVRAVDNFPCFFFLIEESFMGGGVLTGIRKEETRG